MTVKVYDWIKHHARRVPDQTASVDLHSGRHFSYVEMDRRVDQCAGMLAELGVGRGDRCAVLLPNTSDFFEVQFACARLGAIFVPLNWRLTVPELTYIVGDAGAKVLIHDADFAETAEALQEPCEITHLVETSAEGANNAYEYGLAAASPPPPPPDLTHDDTWTIMYTSGTTGHPKGAIITHGMTFWNAINLGGPHLVGPQSKLLNVLPLFHTGGLNCYCNPVFHAGGTVEVVRDFEPGAALKLLGDPERGYTHFFGIPAHYLFMSQHPDFDSTDFGHVQVAGIGGAPSSLPLLETWAARGLSLAQGFGMTETSPAVTALDAPMALAKAGSVGLPVLHTQVRLVAEDGSDITEPDTIGELWAKGPNITPGYWNKPEATAETITDGWLHTGDAARFDEDGYYYIVDRWKDMYISGGENVYPAEVENVIYQLPHVAEVAIIGVPDERWGEVGCAVVAVKPGQLLEETDVLRHCQDKLARYKQPKSVRFVDALPRNATGKVLKRELR
ncbi:MAG: long-chain fatty acid--CoA ligase [Alphaproteobacteria bacterium]